MQQHFLLDASIYVFRAYFALAPEWRAANGHPTHAVHGYANFLCDFLRRAAPRHVLATFDESLGSCFRNQIHPGYKCSRALPDAALAFQLRACRELTGLLGIASVASARFEADDLIASAARAARGRGDCAVVISRDKDLGQVLRGADDRLWDFPAAAPLDRATYRARHGIEPEQVPDLLALCGDPVDDVPGVPGIGVKTAVALLQRHPDVHALLGALDAVAASSLRGAARIARLLEAHREQILMARRLTTLAEDAFAADALPATARQPAQRAALADFADFHGLGERLRARLLAVADAAA